MYQIQVILPLFLYVEECNFNTPVEIKGRLIKSPKENQSVEIQASKLTVLGHLDLKSFPFAPRKTYPPDYVRQYLHLRPKTNINSSILRLSSLITSVLHTTLSDEEYVHVFTPILTSNDCEGAGEIFTARPSSEALCKQMSNNQDFDESYFNKKVYLSVSGQLHLEAIAG